jgi:urease subunit gamma
MNLKMMLAPREIEKMMIWTAAQIAEGRKKRGVKLNYPESIAYISNFVVEGAREGKTVAELMIFARDILKKTDVMEGVPEMIHTVQVEVTFPDGTKLVTIHDPIQ